MIHLLKTVVAASISLAAGSLVAQAAPFSIAVGVITGADGSANFSLAGDTTHNTASFSYHENNQANDFVNFVSTDFTDAKAGFARSGYTSSPDGILTTNSIEFAIFDPKFSYTIDNTDGSSQTIKGFSLAFTLHQRVAPDGTIFEYDTIFSSPTLLGSAFESLNSATTVAGNPFMSPVPLPASAPMFGAALLALGAVGCGLKRKKAAAAACAAA